MTALLSDTDVGTNSDDFEATIDIAAGAKLTSVKQQRRCLGLLRMETFTDIRAIDKVETEAYGLGGVSLGFSEVSVDSKSKINVTGATIKSNA
ncbi:hypothetical protein LP419_39675 [Massilia sp. H-1]|nr:hypothetical protein LP419_39675 [Massilia sp. H-1]